MKIQEVKSPGGVTAWLVEEHAIPLIAMRFAFESGNAQDPDGKEGVAHFLASMMDEGAGDLTAKNSRSAWSDCHAHELRRFARCLVRQLRDPE
jgi:zinc protease